MFGIEVILIVLARVTVRDSLTRDYIASYKVNKSQDWDNNGRKGRSSKHETFLFTNRRKKGLLGSSFSSFPR